MGRLSFFIKYAISRLLRGGQRVFVAILAVTFGVMSLITMMTTANTMSNIMTLPQHIELGGDILASQNENVGLEQLEKIEYLRQSGVIEAYSPIQEVWEITMRTYTNGQARYIMRGFGVDPASYPLYGDFEIVGGRSIAQLLQDDNAILITQDIAQSYDVKVGDVLRITTRELVNQFIDVYVTGIVQNNPTSMGERVYYNLNLSAMLRPEQAPFDYVAIRTSAHDLVQQELGTENWALQSASHFPAEQDGAAKFFTLMLRGAGVLGLIVGGIGIANTMQVLLTQRRQEVGILKTLGYTQQDLLLMFGIEAMLLGLIGSILGGIIGIFTSQVVVQILANTGTMLISSGGVDLIPLISGMMIGVVTTLIFAFQAILKTSRTRPSVIFRQETSAQATQWGWTPTLLTYAFLLIPSTVITSIIMGSVIEGIGVLVVALGGLIVFSILLGVSTWVILRFLPTFGNNFLMIARNNMRKRASAMLFSMIALFIGIVTAGFSLLIFDTGATQFTNRQDKSTATANLMVEVNQDDLEPVKQFLAQQGVTTIDETYHVQLTMGDSSYRSEVRTLLWDAEIVEGQPFSNDSYGVYLENRNRNNDQQTVDITLADGSIHTLPVLGYYENLWITILKNGIYNPLLSTHTMQTLGLTAPVSKLYVFTDLSQETAIAEEIGAQFPNAITSLRQDMMDTMNTQFYNLLLFAGAMASLAFLAGLMLMANVVSLGMIERRFEIGVLKAVGYTRRHILGLFVLEYGMIGIITSILGILGLQVILIVLGFLSPGYSSFIALSPLTTLIIIVGGTVLIILTVLTASWNPSGVRPMVILKQE